MYAGLMETPVVRVIASAAAALDSGGSVGLRIVSKSLLSFTDSSEWLGTSPLAVHPGSYVPLNVLSFHTESPMLVH